MWVGTVCQTLPKLKHKLLSTAPRTSWLLRILCFPLWFLVFVPQSCSMRSDCPLSSIEFLLLHSTMEVIYTDGDIKSATITDIDIFPSNLVVHSPSDQRCYSTAFFSFEAELYEYHHKGPDVLESLPFIKNRVYTARHEALDAELQTTGFYWFVIETNSRPRHGEFGLHF